MVCLPVLAISCWFWLNIFRIGEVGSELPAMTSRHRHICDPRRVCAKRNLRRKTFTFLSYLWQQHATVSFSLVEACFLSDYRDCVYLHDIPSALLILTKPRPLPSCIMRRRPDRERCGSMIILKVLIAMVMVMMMMKKSSYNWYQMCPWNLEKKKNPQTCEILTVTLPHFLLIVIIDELMMMMSSYYCTCIHQMQLTGCRPVTTTKFVNKMQYNTTVLCCIVFIVLHCKCI